MKLEEIERKWIAAWNEDYTEMARWGQFYASDLIAVAKAARECFNDKRMNVNEYYKKRDILNKAFEDLEKDDET